MSTRFARVVESETWKLVPSGEKRLKPEGALKLLQREHAAVRRKVKAMNKLGEPHSMANSATINRFCKKLLAWLNERGR